MRLIIKKGLILDLAGTDLVKDVLVEGGLISAIEENISAEQIADATVIDASGLMVSAGFIDLHCHLREPGFTQKETIKSGSKAAASGGFTTICCMPNTEPPIDTPEIVEQIQALAETAVIRVLPIGCVSEGRGGQELVPIAALKKAGVVGFSDDGSPVASAELMRIALIATRQLEMPVIDHCEDPVLSAEGVINEGAVATRLGLKGIPAAAEEVMIARDIKLAAETGGHIHIAHISTAGSVALIRKAKAKGIIVTAEVTPHHLTLTEDEVIEWGTQAKVNPPLRTQFDIEALIEGLIDGTIDAIATDHAPHTEADKATSLADSAFGISGFETAFGALMTLVHSGRLDIKTLISRLTVDPARVLNLPGITGKLAVGEPADIVLFDPDKVWVVDPAQFLSKGKNTPLAGVTLKGRVLLTISQGRIAYQDTSVRI